MVMYKIDRRGGGGVQKSYTRTDPKIAIKLRNILSPMDVYKIFF